MSVLYPDNPNRERRVQQLSTQIGSIQSNIKLRYDGSKDFEKDKIAKKVDAILSQHGVKNIAELKEKLGKSVPPEVLKKYEEMKAKYDEEDEHLQATMTSIGVVGMVSSVVGGGAKTIQFIACGDLAAATATVLRAVTILETDVAKAFRLLRVAATAFKEFIGGIELSGFATKCLKMVKLAGTVVSAVSVLLEGILLIFEAVQGAQRRTELRNAIHDLVHRRMSVETINVMADTYSHYLSNLYGFCLSVKNHPNDPTRQSEEIDETVNDLKDDLGKITFDKIWKRLEDLDKGPLTWTGEEHGQDAVVTEDMVRNRWDKEFDPKKFKLSPKL